VPLSVIVYVLTALAAVVVVLTRARLRGGRGAGRAYVGRRLLSVHTVAGVLAVVLWLVFLLLPDDTSYGSTIGIVALGLWWVTALAGLMVLLRWLPSHGKHSSEASEDSWSDGPGLSVLAHVGMFVGVIVFTYAYLSGV
jgi:hypothetical protein